MVCRFETKGATGRSIRALIAKRVKNWLKIRAMSKNPTITQNLPSVITLSLQIGIFLIADRFCKGYIWLL
jgi:hypothetical protein